MRKVICWWCLFSLLIIVIQTGFISARFSYTTVPLSVSAAESGLIIHIQEEFDAYTMQMLNEKIDRQYRISKSQGDFVELVVWVNETFATEDVLSLCLEIREERTDAVSDYIQSVNINRKKKQPISLEVLVRESKRTSILRELFGQWIRISNDTSLFEGDFDEISRWSYWKEQWSNYYMDESHLYLPLMDTTFFPWGHTLKFDKVSLGSDMVIANINKPTPAIPLNPGVTILPSGRSIDNNKKLVALTFDDGPHKNIDHILGVLKKYDSAATFFLLGTHISRYPSVIAKIESSASEIGNHAYSHNNLRSMSQTQIRSEIELTDALIVQYGGSVTQVFRPPFGQYNQNVLNAAFDKRVVNWSVDPADWDHRTWSKTFANIKANLKDGSIILLHDWVVSTSENIETLVKYLLDQNYQLVTVSELIVVRNVTSQFVKIAPR